MSSDAVMVQPVRTFMEGRVLVHPESPPYRVSRSRALELRASGLVRHVETEAEAEPEAPPVPLVEPEPEPQPVPVASRKRGRPPKVR
jgi:hypothetical protein